MVPPRIPMADRSHLISIMNTKIKMQNVCDTDKAVSLSGSAGALMMREDGCILLVKQPYQETWNIPGGIIEDGESPREACRREVLEELALRIEKLPLLCVDHLSASTELPERKHHIFLGGTLTSGIMGRVKLQESEISEIAFVQELDIPRLCSAPLAVRLRVAIDAYRTQKSFYIRDGLVSEAAQLGAEH